MKNFELLKRRGGTSQFKSLLLPESPFFSFFQMLEVKIQIGVSEHILGNVEITAMSPKSAGVEGPAINLPPARSGCGKENLVLWGMGLLFTVTGSQAKKKKS